MNNDEKYNQWTYQWGYDDANFNYKPFIDPGQVYQIFIPKKPEYFDASNAGGLNTTRFWFWVEAIKGDCHTKVYFNGPHSHRKAIEISKEVLFSIFPNPNSGSFTLEISGEIYGEIHERIFNSLGKIIYEGLFQKSSALTTQNIDLKYISSGLYFLQLIDDKNQMHVVKVLVK